MKINTFSQNNLSFGVRKPFNGDLKIETLQQLRRPDVDLPPNPTDVHYLLYKKIISTKGNQSLKSLFNSIKSGHGSNELKEAVKKCKDNLKRIFWETCDRFFDVQLTKPMDQLRDDDERHIPDDDELKAIFPKERTSFNAIKFIDYYVESIPKGEFSVKKYSTESHVSKSTVKKYNTAINEIYAYLSESIGKTDEEFQEYIVKKCDEKNYTICSNKELFSYAVRKLKELKRKLAKIGIVSYEDIKTANTKKFIDYYCHCYFEAKQKGKKLNEVKMVNSFFKTSSKEAKNSTLTVHKSAIKMIYSNLDKSIGKTDEEFQQYILNECNGGNYNICKNEKLFSYAVEKLKELKQKEAEMKDAPRSQATGQTLSADDRSSATQKPLSETNDAQQNIQTETNATGEIERDPYEVTLNNQRNEDGNFDSFKSSGDSDQELVDLLCPQSSDDPGLTGDDLVDSLPIEGHGLFSNRFPQQSFKDPGLPGNNLVGSQGLKGHGIFSDRFLQSFKDLGLSGNKYVGSQDFEGDGIFSNRFPQQSLDDLGLSGNKYVGSQDFEGDGIFSNRFPQQSLDDLGLSGDKFVDSQVLEEHELISDRFNLPKLEDFKFGLNSSQLPDTNSFANDNKLNLSRPHESYDDTYSDKRRKM